MAEHEFPLATLKEVGDRFGICELDDVTSFRSPMLETSFHPAPAHRLCREELSDDMRARLDFGLSKMGAIACFLGCAPPLNKGVPFELHASFRVWFDELWEKGFRGDDLFRLLVEYCHHGLGYCDPKRAADGSSIGCFLSDGLRPAFGLSHQIQSWS